MKFELATKFKIRLNNRAKVMHERLYTLQMHILASSACYSSLNSVNVGKVVVLKCTAAAATKSIRMVLCFSFYFPITKSEVDFRK